MKGLVIKTTGSFYEVLTEDDQQLFTATLRGKFKISGLKVTNPIAVGDYVNFDQDPKDPSKGVIFDIEPRHNYIVRNSTHKTAHGHIIASNIDQAIIVATLVQPKTSLGFIDRFLVTAESFRIPVIIALNKCDLYDKDMQEYAKALEKMYSVVGYPLIHTSTVNEKGLDSLKKCIRGKKTLFSGHSGVGKSSLLNLISPGLGQKTQEVSNFAQKGVHTTTFAEMFKLADHTFIIDTPGIKELGLNEISPEELSHYFPEMRELLNQCKYNNCLHLNEPNCAVRTAVEKSVIPLSRYNSYLSMIQNQDNRR